MLDVISLSAGYGRKTVARDISFSVAPGEILTMIGQNGSGKSTVLKTLAGLLPPLSGEIRVDGRPVSAMTRGERAKAVSGLFTERPKTDLLTCRELVESGRYPHTGAFGMLGEADKRAADEAMRLTDTGSLASALFTELSDGQRQRVMLARAVCREPKVLLLDEPTSFLDIHYKLTFLELLDRLRKERGLAVVMSLHETELAAKISDTVLLIKDGRCEAIGTPDSLLSRERLREHFDLPAELADKYLG